MTFSSDADNRMCSSLGVYLHSQLQMRFFWLPVLLRFQTTCLEPGQIYLSPTSLLAGSFRAISSLSRLQKCTNKQTLSRNWRVRKGLQTVHIHVQSSAVKSNPPPCQVLIAAAGEMRGDSLPDSGR